MNVPELKVIAAKDVLEKMKQADCGGLNFETDVLFSNYPLWPTAEQWGRSKAPPITKEVFDTLVHLIEQFITNDANQIFYDYLSYKFIQKEQIVDSLYLDQLTNFLTCFKKWGGDIKKLGSTVYPDYFTLGFRACFIGHLLGISVEQLTGLVENCSSDDVANINTIVTNVLRFKPSGKEYNIFRDTTFVPMINEFVFNNRDFFIVSRQGGVELLRTNLEKYVKGGANINMKNVKSGATIFLKALITMSMMNTFNEEVLRTLVEYGADINSTMDYKSHSTYTDYYLKKYFATTSSKNKEIIGKIVNFLLTNGGRVTTSESKKNYDKFKK